MVDLKNKNADSCAPLKVYKVHVYLFLDNGRDGFTSICRTFRIESINPFIAMNDVYLKYYQGKSFEHDVCKIEVVDSIEV